MTPDPYAFREMTADDLPMIARWLATPEVVEWWGDPDMIGAGHGGVFLRRLATRLRDGGAPVVAIDPDEDNLRARRAYARAGFVGDGLVETGEGPAVLMLFGG